MLRRTVVGLVGKVRPSPGAGRQGDTERDLRRYEALLREREAIAGRIVVLRYEAWGYRFPGLMRRVGERPPVLLRRRVGRIEAKLDELEGRIGFRRLRESARDTSLGGREW